jgi:hypothetical protein
MADIFFTEFQYFSPLLWFTSIAIALMMEAVSTSETSVKFYQDGCLLGCIAV